MILYGAGVAAWDDPAWLDAAHVWISRELAARGRTVGRVEQVHVRPWSTVLRVETAEGAVFFKANADGLTHEARVVAVLAGRCPELVPPPLATDGDRGWLLLADAGTCLRDLVAAERSVDRWREVLPLYGRLQRAVEPDVPALLAAGCPDRRLATLPAALAVLLDELEDAPVLEAEERRRLRDALPSVARLCDEIAAVGVPETVQHDDLNDGQIYVSDGAYRVLDWADACVTHPFLSLSVALEGVVAWGPDDVAGSVDTGPFRDAYLQAFADLADRATLVRSVTAALRLGWVCRAVNGHTAGGEEPGRTATRLRMFLDGAP